MYINQERVSDILIKDLEKEIQEKSKKENDGFKKEYAVCITYLFHLAMLLISSTWLFVQKISSFYNWGRKKYSTHYYHVRVLILVYNILLNTLFHFRHFYTEKDTHAMLENFRKTLRKTDSRQLSPVSIFISKNTLKTRCIFFTFIFDDIMCRFKSQNLF